MVGGRPDQDICRALAHPLDQLRLGQLPRPESFARHHRVPRQRRQPAVDGERTVHHRQHRAPDEPRARRFPQTPHRRMVRPRFLGADQPPLRVKRFAPLPEARRRPTATSTFRPHHARRSAGPYHTQRAPPHKPTPARPPQTTSGPRSNRSPDKPPRPPHAGPPPHPSLGGTQSRPGAPAPVLMPRSVVRQPDGLWVRTRSRHGAPAVRPLPGLRAWVCNLGVVEGIEGQPFSKSQVRWEPPRSGGVRQPGWRSAAKRGASSARVCRPLRRAEQSGLLRGQVVFC